MNEGTPQLAPVASTIKKLRSPGLEQSPVKSKNPPALKGTSLGSTSPEALLKSPMKAAGVSSDVLADHNLLHITKFRVE